METFDGPYVIAHGDVWIGDPREGRHVCDGTGELAVAFDSEDGTLHKHGEASRVAEWAAGIRKKFAQAGAQDLAAAIEVISFPACAETVLELNACAAVTGRVTGIASRLEAIGRLRPDLVARPRYPS